MNHDTPFASEHGPESEENGASASVASGVWPQNTQPKIVRRVGVSTRAIVLGALLIPFNAFWMVRQERVMFGPYPSTMSLFANVVFALFVLVGLNGLCRCVAPRLAFAQGELLTLYTMLAISTGLAGLDGAGILSQMIPHGAWFGQTNHWTGFLDAFPSWLVVRDRDVLRGHFLGNSTFYRADVLRAWITPILAWTGFITLLLWVANCLNVLVRRQWADRERLTFPIIWLPLEMTDTHDTLSGGRPFFKNPLMWGGFAIAALLSLWNGCAYLYPSIPMLPIGVTDLKPLLTAKPWSAIDWFPVTFYPLVIGLGFLLPLDLLFSCWFFFLFWKAQMVVSSAMAWDTTPDFPFIKEQGFGSILGLFAFYLYTGRHTYAAIWRGAFRQGEKETERQGDRAQDIRYREEDEGRGNGKSGGVVGSGGAARAGGRSGGADGVLSGGACGVVGGGRVLCDLSADDSRHHAHSGRTRPAPPRFPLHGAGRHAAPRVLHSGPETSRTWPFSRSVSRSRAPTAATPCPSAWKGCRWRICAKWTPAVCCSPSCWPSWSAV